MTAKASPVAIHGIHHFAYKCRDAEETRHFYEDILGLPLTMCVEANDVKTTTGETTSFIHFFFEMGDGNYMAFFDFGDGLAPELDAATPKFANHLAFKVADADAMAQAQRLLEAHDIPYQGPMVHEFVQSIYFWDPNGVRLEYALTVSDADELRAFQEEAPRALARWSERVRQAKRERA